MGAPSRLRDARNFTHPSLGSFTRAWRRFSFSSSILMPAGNRNDGAHRRRSANAPQTCHVGGTSVGPDSATRTPAMAGPMARAAFIAMLVSAAAAGICSRGTNSG